MGSKITQPVVLNAGTYSAKVVEELRSRAASEQSLLQGQLEELFEIEFPSAPRPKSLAQYTSEYLARHPGGDWVFFPWNRHLIHTVTQEDIYRLRTNRNQLLITDDEQRKLREARIAVAGLSVGGAIVQSLVYSGIGSHYALADFDSLETANLNRIQYGLADIGRRKAHILAEKLWGLQPDLNIETFTEAVSAGNLKQFLNSSFLPNLIFDEVDDFLLKVELRRRAKEIKIPLVMMTALGDSVLIDVERYDTQPDTRLFNGLVGELTDEILAGSITEELKRQFAARLVGIDHVPTRAIESLTQIGKSLVGRPQLASTVQVEAGIGCYIAREILLGAGINSGRYRVDFANAVDLQGDFGHTEKRDRLLSHLLTKGK